MREFRLSGSEGGGAAALPTPISAHLPLNVEVPLRESLC